MSDSNCERVYSIWHTYTKQLFVALLIKADNAVNSTVDNPALMADLIMDGIRPDETGKPDQEGDCATLVSMAEFYL